MQPNPHPTKPFHRFFPNFQYSIPSYESQPLFASLRESTLAKHTSSKRSKSLSQPPAPQTNAHPYTLIEAPTDLKSAFADIRTHKILGVDLEFFSKKGKAAESFICLIQISTVDMDYIIDVFQLRDAVTPFVKEIFSSLEYIKIFQGCKTDLALLKTDLGIDVVNVFDTAEAQKILDSAKTSKSLGKLYALYFHEDMDKGFQKSDWRLRPLHPKMILYARNDSRVMLELFVILRESLDQIGANGGYMLSELAVRCNEIVVKRAKGVRQRRVFHFMQNNN
jgi:hypothetical protein